MSNDIMVPPLLTAVRELRWRTLAGRSTAESFRLYLEDNHDALAELLRERWTLKFRAGLTALPPRPLASHYGRSFWDLIERGTAGEPIGEALACLEDEVERAAEAELEQHVSTLPFKVLIPLLIFQFPAHLVLLLGPMLRDLGQQLGS